MYRREALTLPGVTVIVLGIGTVGRSRLILTNTFQSPNTISQREKLSVLLTPGAFDRADEYCI